MPFCSQVGDLTCVHIKLTTVNLAACSSIIHVHVCSLFGNVEI